MPIQELGHAHDLLRRAKAVRGDLPFRMEFNPHFNYGRSSHQVEQCKDEVVFTSQGPDATALRLRSSVPLWVENGTALAEFRLRAGESAAFILEDANQTEGSPSAAPDYISESFKETMNFWQGWIARSRYRGQIG